MAWIRQVPIAEATGALKREFDKAIKRAGRVWHIVHIMSLNAPVLKTSMQFYSAIMQGDSPLSRVQREMIATVVASQRGCYY